MADTKPEVEIALEPKELAKRFSAATSALSTMPDPNISMPTRPDIGTNKDGQHTGSVKKS
jgi:hypothetical protein